MTEREIEHARKWLRDHPGQGQDSVQARVVAKMDWEADRLRTVEKMAAVVVFGGALGGVAAGAIIGWLL